MTQNDSILISIRIHSTYISSLHVTRITVVIAPLVSPLANELIPTFWCYSEGKGIISKFVMTSNYVKQ